MASPSSRKWLSLAVLATIIPISLLTTFKLTGIIREPPTIAKTIEAEKVNWNMTRPSQTLSLHNEWAENYFSEDMILIRFTAHVSPYMENDESWGDSLWMTVNGTVEVQKGFIHSMCIRFSQTDDQAFLSIHKFPPWSKTHNLNIAELVTLGSNTQEAYTSAICVDQPENSSFEIMVSWHFLDPNSVSHWITASLETVYFNGTAYRKVIMPIQLGVLAA